MILEKEKPQYENRLIAYIDILGFKEIIKQSETDNSKLKLIHESLNFLKGFEKPEEWDLSLIELEESAQMKGINKFDISSKVACTCFSDLIVVSVKVNNDFNKILSTLVTNLSYIGAKLMTDKILIRGAITYGKLIHSNDGIIMGQGLIDAYNLEVVVSKFPRIILSNKLLKKLNYPLKEKRIKFPYHQYISRFSDGCVGFHQMIYFQVIEPSVNHSDDALKLGLNKIKQTIIDGLDNSFENPHIFEKYLWLKEEYQKLIINKNGIKNQIHELNKGISGQNIHYSYTDKFYNNKKETL